MTTKKKNNRGSIYAVAGMALMAHKFGVSCDICITDTELKDDFEYEVSFRDAPEIDWSKDHNDIEAVDANRKAILFKCAMTSGAAAGMELDSDTREHGADFFVDLYLEQRSESEQAIVDFLSWYGKEDCVAEDLKSYFRRIFDHVAREGDWKILLEDIMNVIVMKQGEIDAALIRCAVNPFVPFGLLEYEAPPFYPTWHNALNCITYSCR